MSPNTSTVVAMTLSVVIQLLEYGKIAEAKESLTEVRDYLRKQEVKHG